MEFTIHDTTSTLESIIIWPLKMHASWAPNSKENGLYGWRTTVCSTLPILMARCWIPLEDLSLSHLNIGFGSSARREPRNYFFIRKLGYVPDSSHCKEGIYFLKSCFPVLIIINKFRVCFKNAWVRLCHVCFNFLELDHLDQCDQILVIFGLWATF